MEPRQRLYFFDNVKCVLICLVVVGHIVDVGAVADHSMAKAALVFIYSFHMPLFIFVSGLFVKREKLGLEKVLGRMFFFIALGYILKVLQMVVPFANGAEVTFSLLSDSMLPWYMFAMAAFYTLAYVLRRANQIAVMACSVVLGVFIGYVEQVGDFLYLSRIIVFFPFFWAGHILRPDSVEKAASQVPWRVVGAVFVVLLAAFCIFQTDVAYSYRGLFTGRNSFHAVRIEDCSWVNRAIAYAASAVMCIGVLGLVPHRCLPVISTVGTRTLQIYLLHFSFITEFEYLGLLAAVSSLPGAGWMLLVPIGLALTLLLSVRVLEPPLNALSNACTQIGHKVAR